MQFLVDECTGPKWLREQGHDVVSVYDESPGLDDNHIIQKASTDNRILITNDKDFGEKIFRERQMHKGVIFLRLEDERAANKIAVLQKILKNYPDQIVAHFIVATETKVRIIPVRT